MLDGGFIDLLGKDALLLFCSNLVFFSEQFDNVEDEFLLDSVGVLPYSEGGWQELVPGQLHAKTLTKLDGVGDVL